MSTYEIKTGDALPLLVAMPSESVQTIITSPPYWGLRDYGTGKWEAGDPSCQHTVGGQVEDNKWAGAITSGQRPGVDASRCLKCGATRIDNQLGLERTPEEYVIRLVGILREARRVLRKDGIMWLNLGDSYFSAPTGSLSTKKSLMTGGRATQVEATKRPSKMVEGCKPKDLVGIPWMTAFALRADGWYLRQDIIWNKPNAMPESVKDRCTKSHEYIFLLSKSPKYYFDNKAIEEPASHNLISAARRKRVDFGAVGTTALRGTTLGQSGNQYRKNPKVGQEHRNKRDVWTVSTKPYKGAHFAVFPETLIEPCILAGCPPAGKSCDCQELIYSPLGEGVVDDPTLITGRAGMNRSRRNGEGTRPITRKEQREYADQLRKSVHRIEMENEVGTAAFEHYIRTDKSGARPIPALLLDSWIKRGWLTAVSAECSCPEKPAGVVLDPFMGSGTTGVVALKHGRNFIGLELNPEYIKLAHERIKKWQTEDTSVGAFTEPVNPELKNTPVLSAPVVGEGSL